jgi:hypothetical protein
VTPHRLRRLHKFQSISVIAPLPTDFTSAAMNSEGVPND